ncbi:hypothetical protein DBT_1258 [Dissulfuribacter thermophilus]|uniref:Uncharacterized protein n=2 Tax=Dissulfuribacter thermophilus TaxID=1156395 RepID=A0A1B9F6W1_9BACT|nr:hypothetical protein DBT_1258 [Dissulfuribacter thermophilus]
MLIFIFLGQGMRIALGAQQSPPLDLEFYTSIDGTVTFLLTLKDPSIKGVILKVRFPKGLKVLSSRPPIKSLSRNHAKWFVNVRGRRELKFVVKFNRSVKKSEIIAEALFKQPGTMKMQRVKAR